VERIEPLLRALAAVPADIQAMAAVRPAMCAWPSLASRWRRCCRASCASSTRRYPGVRVELNESPTSAQLESLKTGEIACGFFHPDATATPGCPRKLLLLEKNGVLLPADHKLAHARKLRLRDLAETPFVMFPRAHNPLSTIACSRPSSRRASPRASPTKSGRAPTPSVSCAPASAPRSWPVRSPPAAE